MIPDYDWSLIRSIRDSSVLPLILDLTHLCGRDFDIRLTSRKKWKFECKKTRVQPREEKILQDFLRSSSAKTPDRLSTHYNFPVFFVKRKVGKMRLG